MNGQGFYVNGKPVSCDNVVDLGLLPDGQNFILRDDLTYIDADEGSHVAAHGLTTDGGSIPRIFWRMIGHPWHGRHRYAFIVHDQECRDVYMMPRPLRDGARKEADKTLRQACLYLLTRDLPKGKLARWVRMAQAQTGSGLIYAGVRIGWTCWIRYQKPKGKR